MLQHFITGRRRLPSRRSPWRSSSAPARGAGHSASLHNAPPSYTVQKGDTLWGIAGKFLKDPWRWPDVWRMNREQIRIPTGSIPGDVVVADSTVERPSPQLGARRPRETVRDWRPPCASHRWKPQAIPAIPPGDIEPFLTRPLVTGPDGLDDAAEIVRGRDDRVIRGEGDRVYVVGIDAKDGDFWFIYRPGERLVTTAAPCSATRTGSSAPRASSASPTSRPCRSSRRGKRSSSAIACCPRRARRCRTTCRMRRRSDVAGRILKLAFEGAEMGRGYVVTIDKARRRGSKSATCWRSTA